MFQLRSFETRPRGYRLIAHVVGSPVTVERSREALLRALGPRVAIDGVEYLLLDVEFALEGPEIPVQAGEYIRLLVELAPHPNLPTASEEGEHLRAVLVRTAFEEGYWASKMGEPLEANPYPEGEAREEWERGHRQATAIYYRTLGG